jgi:dephospho-CoA kinase
VVHDLYETEPVRAAVVERFGAEVAPNGVVDRAALATRAFATEEDRHWLEQLLWPLVGEEISSWRVREEHVDRRPRALVVETPLLFEAGLDRGYDATIAIVANERVRAERARSRDHRALAERTARQLSQQEKAQRATFAVVNDGTEAELEAKLSAILDRLCR